MNFFSFFVLLTLTLLGFNIYSVILILIFWKLNKKLNKSVFVGRNIIQR